ncbi:MAG: SDR family oxidoreductase [Acidimicrobiales bacterium]|nr:SDR family oxidoreductase [Acidimicrobiales bacterium]
MAAVDPFQPLCQGHAVPRLEHKVVAVAGGAGGIGTATCERLAAEGAAVVVGDLDGDAARRVARGLTDAGGRAVGVDLDVTDESSVRGLIETATSSFGGLDGLHANAADLSPATIGGDTDVVSMSTEVFDHVLDVNLRGHVLCTRHAVPALLERGGGAIVYTASAAAFLGEPTRPAYAISKAGLCALVRHVAARWGRERIRANAVAPGLTVTPAMAEHDIGDILARALRQTRSWRLGEPDDIAAMVAHLLSDDGQWINGQAICVDGGTVLR